METGIEEILAEVSHFLPDSASTGRVGQEFCSVEKEYGKCMGRGEREQEHGESMAKTRAKSARVEKE